MQCIQWDEIPTYMGNELYCTNSKALPTEMQMGTSLLYNAPDSPSNSKKSGAGTPPGLTALPTARGAG